MKLPDELLFLNRWMFWERFQPTRGAAFRIAGWTALFLLLFNLCVPSVPVIPAMQKNLEQEQIIGMSTSFSDPRWARGDIQTMHGDGKTAIAWIAGSSIRIPRGEVIEGQETVYRFLPAEVAGVLKSKYALDTQTYAYLLIARRALDTHTMVLDAVARKPDAIVLELNPFWDLNDWALFYRPNLMNKGASLWANRYDWPLILALTSPGNLLWAWFGRRFPLIENAADYLKAMARALHRQTGFVRITKTVGEKKSARTLNYEAPLSFWLVHRVHSGDPSGLTGRDERSDVEAWQADAMARNDPDPRKLTYKTLRNTFQVLAASGIPALIYLAPASEKLRGFPEASRGYTSVRNTLRDLRRSRTSSNKMKIIIDLPAEVEASLSYRDLLHLEKEGRLPEYLAGEMSTLLEREREAQ